LAFLQIIYLSQLFAAAVKDKNCTVMAECGGYTKTCTKLRC